MRAGLKLPEHRACQDRQMHLHWRRVAGWMFLSANIFRCGWYRLIITSLISAIEQTTGKTTSASEWDSSLTLERSSRGSQIEHPRRLHCIYVVWTSAAA